MEALNIINKEILSVTATIQNEFPELYKNLRETNPVSAKGRQLNMNRRM